MSNVSEHWSPWEDGSLAVLVDARIRSHKWVYRPKAGSCCVRKMDDVVLFARYHSAVVLQASSGRHVQRYRSLLGMPCIGHGGPRDAPDIAKMGCRVCCGTWYAAVGCLLVRSKRLARGCCACDSCVTIIVAT